MPTRFTKEQGAGVGVNAVSDEMGVGVGAESVIEAAWLIAIAEAAVEKETKGGDNGERHNEDRNARARNSVPRYMQSKEGNN